MRCRHESVPIALGPILLQGDLSIPEGAPGLVIFSHGSGGGRRHSPRDIFVAKRLQRSQWATLLVDLLTEEEGEVFGNCFDVALLTRRLLGATRWARRHLLTAGLPVGYFGASTGAASALCAAAELGNEIRAVVCRGGRDFVAEALGRIVAPTLLIAGDQDSEALALTWQAFHHLKTVKQLEIIRGATHLFAEPRALEQVGDLTAEWFALHLPQPAELLHTVESASGQNVEEKPREVWLD